MATVSVIIPAYNAENTIEACVKSVLAQQYSVGEIIIVNDGSIDNTKEICDRLSENEKVVTVHQENRGVSAARNLGLNLVSGDYVVFIDSDDVIEPNYIGMLMSACAFDFVTAGFYMQDRDKNWHTYMFPDESISTEYLKKYPSKYMGKYYFGGPVGKLFRREIIEKYKIEFNTEIHSGEDTLFIFEYLTHTNNIRILPLSGYRYYYYGTSLAHKFHDDYWKWKIKVEESILKFFEPVDEHENDSLVTRSFDVLKDLLRDYSKQMSSEELVTIYEHPFFEKAIRYKEKNGAFMDRMLIFAMQRQNYKLYVKIDSIRILVCRIKNKIKRTLKG